MAERNAASTTPYPNNSIGGPEYHHNEQQPNQVAHTTQNGSAGVGHGPNVQSNSNSLEILCGPLLNYRRTSGDAANPTWHGSVLIVAKPGQLQPDLQLKCLSTGNGHSQMYNGQKLYEDPAKAFWRFTIDLPIQEFEATWEYSITPAVGTTPKIFVVPSTAQSMRIMFHSCNGFSVGTDVDAWSGPALWNDVLRMHKSKPFHVMIGGGDQIYNDGVRVDGPLAEWTSIGNPRKRREYPFGEDMRSRCDDYYFNNYIRWYGQEPFKSANCSIPQLNIWDDHDIIDGFGSYTDRFMRCAVFRGIGGVAHKYYMLFQHHIAPPKSTFTTDAPQTTHAETTTPADPKQLENTWVLTGDKEDPSYIIGAKPGPYVEERSRSMYCQLGARIAFLGIDARTERTRHQVNYPETYDAIFQRLDYEISQNSQIKHLILLLGVPIAYPRLQWLENIFSSPLIAPIRMLNKRFGFGGSLFNKFDGNVDLLDDLDDHYTAHNHKPERRELMQRLQGFAKKHSVRVSILGGDVHLAAVGRFFSNTKLEIPAESDWRYMPNIISSAITNKPPPPAVANLLARRNKIHHLDHDTDETLLECFNHDPGMHAEAVKERSQTGEKGPNKKSADSNHTTMPSRNYAIIAESRNHSNGHSNTNGNGTAHAPQTNGTGVNGTAQIGSVDPSASTNAAHKSLPAFAAKHANPRLAIHTGELHAGTEHAAAGALNPTGLGGEYGLDVTLRVEISNKDREGQTEGYGFSICGLDCKAYAQEGKTW
ncbi:hypothetical protein EJ08DRAFT_737818 [Tothia fuscella]|uniref:PhoD-like phosphatase domain-containing protein n=1 Tax=Tothia fuscella TaxID=1048955 RepID=A0A9P4NI76_9PEZI|nr:hypothetical protein EJ08DRAFT_737818 [Tothia fuscella]